MNRRHFLTLTAAAIIPSVSLRKKATPSVAFTFDDPKVSPQPLYTQSQIADQMLNALDHAKVKAALCVCGKRIESDEGKALIEKWDNAGHMITNHTYSHINYNLNSTTYDTFVSDITRGESLIRNYKHFAKFLPFPYLKEGDTIAKRDDLRNWMRSNGYRHAYVTIDASDWYIDDRLKAKLNINLQTDLKPYRDFYLEHLWSRSQFYDSIAQKLTGRSVHHTILLHHALVNGLFLGDLIVLYRSKGWHVIDASESFQDPIFALEPKTLPAGESLIWAMAKETDRYDSILRYPGEDSSYEAPKMDKRGL